jgi:hypothetical protein
MAPNTRLEWQRNEKRESVLKMVKVKGTKVAVEGPVEAWAVKAIWNSWAE